MAEEFGLPGLSALDSPYGLSPRRVNNVVPMPYQMQAKRPIVNQPLNPQRVAQRQAQAGGMPQAQGPTPGTGVLQRQFLPQEQGGAPGFFVGRDIPLERFVQIHKKKESSDNYQALNQEKKGNTASGAYQYTDATWNNYGGYPKAMMAPKEVQDRRYMEDTARRLQRFGGDPFKALVDHYLPAYASDPRRWGQDVKLKGGTVRSPAWYLRYVTRGTELAEPLEAYLQSYGIQ